MTKHCSKVPNTPGRARRQRLQLVDINLAKRQIEGTVVVQQEAAHA